MLNGIVNVPPPVNEPVRSYAPGSPERASLQTPARRDVRRTHRDPAASSAAARCAPADTGKAVCPHDHRPRARRRFHQAGERARYGRRRGAAKEAWREWSEMPWEARAAIFLKAADLLAGPWRDTVNAATMLGQSKTVLPGRDRLRLRAHRLLALQRRLHARASTPSSRSRRADMWNYVEYRAARGLRLRGDAVQLHRDRRQPADGAGADGQHRAVEAGVDGDRLQLLRAASCSRRRGCRRA